ncbi:MAG TPA: hypothetical protein ENN46_00225 [Candidatus Woesearchaeota archaeon]|nr:hypothetical protein [Candidatus Woesearchaeota archaeon]
MKELKILLETGQPLFSRKSVKAKVLFEGATPSREVIKEALAKSLKADASLISVSKIETLYGQNEAIVLCRVYSDAEVMKTIEPDYLVTRGIKKKEE